MWISLWTEEEEEGWEGKAFKAAYRASGVDTRIAPEATHKVRARLNRRISFQGPLARDQPSFMRRVLVLVVRELSEN